MVVVPEEFLKVFKQEPQIPLNLLRNDELLADRLNKALNQRTLKTKETVSIQTPDHISDQTKKETTPTVVTQLDIKETLTTPTVAPRASEQESTPADYHSIEASPSRTSPEERSPLAQRQQNLRRKLQRTKAWDTKTKEVDNWEGGRIKDSNIDAILSYAFDPDGGEPPLGYRQIARHLKIMNETGFPNKNFQKAVDQSSGRSPIGVRRRMPTHYVTQRGKGKCCKKVTPLQWTLY